MVLDRVLAIAFACGLLYWALVEVPTGVGVVILALVPLLTLMLAVIQGVERFRWLGVIGAVVVMGGVYVGVVRGSRHRATVLAPTGTALGSRSDG